MKVSPICACLLAVIVTISNSRSEQLQVEFVQSHDSVTQGSSVTFQVNVQNSDGRGIMHRRPFFELRSIEQPEAIERFPARNVIPWILPKVLPEDGEYVSLNLDVPTAFPPGDAEFRFYIADRSSDGAWQQGVLSDTGSGKSAKVLTRKVKILPSTTTGGINKPVLLIPNLEQAPVIDGNTSEAEWLNASEVALKPNTPGAGNTAATRIKVGYDSGHLYLSFICEEPKIGEVAKNEYPGHDEPVWNNECVEWFLDPTNGSPAYFQFVLDILNHKYDGLGTDFFGYNPSWQSAVKVTDEGWSAEVSIPFGSLNAENPAPGQEWLGNFHRQRKAVTEFSSWNPTSGLFASPAHLGRLIFGSYKDNLLASAKRLAALSQTSDNKQSSERTAFSKKTETTLKRISTLPSSLPLDEFHQEDETLRALQVEYQQLVRREAALEHGGFFVWVADPFERFEMNAQPDFAADQSIGLYVLRNDVVYYAVNIANLSDQPITFRASFRRQPEKPEQEPFDYLLTSATGLNLDWFQAVGVADNGGHITHDAIIPNPAGVMVVPPGKSGQLLLRFSLDDKASGEIKGAVVIHSTDVHGLTPAEIPIQIESPPVVLPRTHPLSGFSWNLFPPEVAGNHPRAVKEKLTNLLDHGINVTFVSGLRHLPRIKSNKDGTFPELDFSKLDDFLSVASGVMPVFWVNLDIWEKKTLRTDLIGLPFDSPEYEKAFKYYVWQVVERFEANGISKDRILVNPYDESIGEEARTLSRWVKEVDPSLKVVINSSTRDIELAKAISPFVDVWAPHFVYYADVSKKDFFNFIRSTGKPVWAYFYASTPSEARNDPTREYLNKWWWASDQQIQGLGYWAQQFYGDPWHRERYPKSLHPVLIYPTDTGLLDSRRWLAWQRGYLDSVLISLARDILSKSGDAESLDKLNQQVAKVVAEPGNVALRDNVTNYLRKTLAAGQGASIILNE